MPGIIGLISPLERDALPAILSRMTAAMRVVDAEERVWIENGVGLAGVGRQARAMLAEREDCVLALAGSVIPNDALSDRLRMVHDARSPERMPQCLLDLFLSLGPSALEGLGGAYAAAVWDSRRARLTIVTDRGGREPIYYWHQGSRLVFASRLRAVAQHPRFDHRIDPVGLFDLIAAEQMLDERTLFANAQALPPAALLTFERGHLQISTYWSPAFYVPGAPAPDEEEAIDGMADRVIAAVARYARAAGASSTWTFPLGGEIVPGPYPPLPPTGGLAGENASEEAAASLPGARSAPGRVLEPRGEQPSPEELVACLLLTGGLDSRLLAAAITRVADPVQFSAATIGHDRARDARFGAEIARVTGLAHAIIPSNPRYLVDFAAECVRRTDGGLNVHAAWILGASAHLRGAGIPAVITGVGAEAVSGRHWLAEQAAATRAEAVQQLSEARWSYSRAAGLLRSEIREGAMAASRDSLRRTIDQAPSDTLLGWSDYFSFRQGRRHPTGSILSDDALVLEPYFDNEMVDYVLRLPPELRGSGRLFKKMIIHRFPEVAAIGYSDTGMLLLDELNGRTVSQDMDDWLRQQGMRVYRKVARAMPFLGLPLVADNPGHAVYYNAWLRGEARDFVMGLVNHRELYADLLDPGRVRRLVEDHMSGRTNAFRLVNAVVTFALWRQVTA